MLEFDDRTARFLDDGYQGGDVVRRRRANLDALELRPGDTVVDIGCGTGLLAQELARAVGPEGRVLAVDPAPAMRAAAEARLDGRPGVEVLDGTAGRLVVGDWHWDTLVWASDDPDRMNRMLGAFDAHFTERAIPALLPPLLPAAGFRHLRTISVPYCDTVLRRDGIAFLMLGLIADFVRAAGALPEHTVEAWRGEQLARADEGRFFQSFTHFVTVAERL